MECEFFVGKNKKERCARYIRAFDPKTKRERPWGWCGQYQCIRNPIYMTRYDFYVTQEELDKIQEEKKRTEEALRKMSKIEIEPPSLTLEELNSPAPPPKKGYAKLGDVLKAVGLEAKRTKEQFKQEMEVEEPAEKKIAEIEMKMMEGEIDKTNDIKRLQSIMKEAEKKGYSEIAVKAQKKINKLSNLVQNKQKGE